MGPHQVVSELGSMTTNKECIENLEAGLGSLQAEIDRMELGVANNFPHLEETITRLSKALFSNKKGSSRNNNPNDHHGHSHTNREDNHDEMDGGQSVFSFKMAKLKFSRFSGDNPIEWFNHVDQFFEFQGTINAQKVSLASFHLAGEANQWWQWLHSAYMEEGRTVTWEIF